MADESRTIIVDVETDIDVQLGEVNKEIDENRKQLKELRKDYGANATEIAKLERQNQNLAKTKRELVKDYNAERGSLNELRRTLAKQVQERNKLNLSTEKGAERFNELQDEIRDLTAVISDFEQAGGDFRRNVGNYPDLLDAANEATGGFITTLTGLLNPVTAVAGGITALGAAYAKTGRGSADLARAQDRLSTALGDVGNSVADLISDDEGGLFDKLLRGLQEQVLGLASTVRSDLIVSIKEQIREFELAQLESDRLAKSFLDQAEAQRQIRDEERNTLAQRISANNELRRIIDDRESEQLAIQEKQISNLKILLSLDQDNLELQLALKRAEFELADIREEAQGFRSEALINDLSLARESAQQQSELRRLQLEEQLLNAEDGSRREFEIRRQIIEETLAIELEAVGNNILAREILEQEARNNFIALENEFIDQKIALLEKEAIEREKIEKKAESEAGKARKREESENKKLADFNKKLRQDSLNNLVTIFGQGESVRKAFGLAEIGVDTGRAIAALTAASEANPANALTFGGAGIAQFAAGLIRITANIASATQILKGSSSGLGGGGGFGGGTSVPTASVATGGGLANVNATLLSQFSQGAETSAAQAGAIGDAVTNQPPVQVSVVDINDAQSARQVKVNEASLV